MYACERLLHTFAKFFSGLCCFSTGFRGILLACIAVCKARTIKLALSSIEDGVTVWHVFTIQKISKDNTSTYYILLPSILYIYIPYIFESITIYYFMIAIYYCFLDVLSCIIHEARGHGEVLTRPDKHRSLQLTPWVTRHDSTQRRYFLKHWPRVVTFEVECNSRM